MKTTGCCFVVVLAAAVFCGTAGAAELHVPGDHGTIQEAIDASGNGDVIIVADDTYTGANNKNLDFGGRAITVKSENGPDACIIDCEGSERGFYFHSGEDTDSIVDGFTIQHGDCRTYVDGHRYGAGVLCVASSPTIIGCVIKQNVAWGGGGMYNTLYAHPEVINCIFVENVADESGCDGDAGGMLNGNASPTVVNCLFIRNRGGTCGGAGALRNMYEGCVAPRFHTVPSSTTLQGTVGVLRTPTKAARHLSIVLSGAITATFP